MQFEVLALILASKCKKKKLKTKLLLNSIIYQFKPACAHTYKTDKTFVSPCFVHAL